MNPHFCLGLILIIIVVSSVICFNLDGISPESGFGSTPLPGHDTEDELAESYEASAEIATPSIDEPTMSNKIHVQPPDFNSQYYQNNNNYEHFDKTFDNIFGTKNDNSNTNEHNNNNNNNNNNNDVGDSDEDGEDLEDVIKLAAFRAKPTTPSPPAPSPQSAKRSPPNTLTHDIEDLLNLIPIDTIKNITMEFYLNDQHVRSVANFIESNEFVDIRNRIFGIRELQDFANHLKTIGINFIELARYVRRKISDANINVMVMRERYTEPGNHGGIDAYLERLLEILPQDQLYFMFFEKMEESHEFSEFMKHIGSNDTERYYEKFKKSWEFHRELRNLDNHGINLEKLVEFFKTIIGWGSFNAKEDV